MQSILESVARLLSTQKCFKYKIQALAKTAGVSTRSRDGFSFDIIELYKNHEDMSYVEFILTMLTLMIRSYAGHDDTKFVSVIDGLYERYFNRMTIAERLFYQLLKFRLGQIQFEKPSWNEEDTPIWVALSAKVDEIEVDDEIPRF